VGSALRFTREWDGKQYEDKGTIVAIEPGQLLSFNYWSGFSGVPDTRENYQIVTFRLTTAEGKTRLQLTQQYIHSEDSKVNSAQNWKMVLSSLKELVEKG
jgi:uncharacterized protein YndB with AHSA1/START domain